MSLALLFLLHSEAVDHCLSEAEEVEDIQLEIDPWEEEAAAALEAVRVQLGHPSDGAACHLAKGRQSMAK
jgi:hypothetical protein